MSDCVIESAALLSIVLGEDDAAALNLGDCIAYATARHAVLPLLFKGDDFARTDIERA